MRRATMASAAAMTCHPLSCRPAWTLPPSGPSHLHPLLGRLQLRSRSRSVEVERPTNIVCVLEADPSKGVGDERRSRSGVEGHASLPVSPSPLLFRLMRGGGGGESDLRWLRGTSHSSLAAAANLLRASRSRAQVKAGHAAANDTSPMRLGMPHRM